MATGGLVLKEAPEPKGVGLVVDYVGQHDAHAAGKKAGFKKGDVFLSAGGRTSHDREPVPAIFQSKMAGEKVPITVLRSGEQLEPQLPMQ